MISTFLFSILANPVAVFCFLFAARDRHQLQDGVHIFRYPGLYLVASVLMTCQLAYSLYRIGFTGAGSTSGLIGGALLMLIGYLIWFDVYLLRYSLSIGHNQIIWRTVFQRATLSPMRISQISIAPAISIDQLRKLTRSHLKYKIAQIERYGDKPIALSCYLQDVSALTRELRAFAERNQIALIMAGAVPTADVSSAAADAPSGSPSLAQFDFAAPTLTSKLVHSKDPNIKPIPVHLQSKVDEILQADYVRPAQLKVWWWAPYAIVIGAVLAMSLFISLLSHLRQGKVDDQAIELMHIECEKQCASNGETADSLGQAYRLTQHEAATMGAKDGDIIYQWHSKKGTTLTLHLMDVPIRTLFIRMPFDNDTVYYSVDWQGSTH
jgi:hypothetical protein